jgi:di/tricarboxylate transporter
LFVTAPQIATLLILLAVLAALISERFRADVVTLTGAGALCLFGVARVEDVQASFANPAIVALASLFVLVEGLHVTGAIGLLFDLSGRLVDRFGKRAIPLLIGAAGLLSPFVNNTPLVVLGTSVLQETARRRGWSVKPLLIPLSYTVILVGTCTLIGSSVNLLVDQMMRQSGLAGFGMFDMTGVGLSMLVIAIPYLAVAAPRLLRGGPGGATEEIVPTEHLAFRPMQAITAAIVLALVVGGAVGGVPIAIAAFVGATLLIALKIVTPEQAYGAVKPQLLVMIAAMLVVGAAIERTGLGALASQILSHFTGGLGRRGSLALIYVATLILTEMMSHAGAVVLLTPIAIGVAQNLGADARPFAIAVMMAASASFVTPLGYQTNTFVYYAGGYRYSDFIKVGLPLTVLTACAALVSIPYFFPF